MWVWCYTGHRALDGWLPERRHGRECAPTDRAAGWAAPRGLVIWGSMDMAGAGLCSGGVSLSEPCMCCGQVLMGRHLEKFFVKWDPRGRTWESRPPPGVEGGAPLRVRGGGKTRPAAPSNCIPPAGSGGRRVSHAGPWSQPASSLH